MKGRVEVIFAFPKLGIFGLSDQVLRSCCSVINQKQIRKDNCQSEATDFWSGIQNGYICSKLQ